MLDEAARRVRVADHMLTMTYPLVKDPKMLISVLENVRRSMDASIAAQLRQARAEGLVPQYSDTPSGRLSAVQRYLDAPAELLRSYQEVRETLREHEESPVEFRRNEKFVICDEGYKMRTLTESSLKRFINDAKALHAHVARMVR